MKRLRESFCKFPVGHRRGHDKIHRSRNVRLMNQRLNPAQDIRQGNPTQILVAIAHHSAQSESKYRQQLFERSSFGTKNHSQTQVNNSHSVRGSRLAGVFALRPG